MPKLTCHCGCVEAEIKVPINGLAKMESPDNVKERRGK